MFVEKEVKKDLKSESHLKWFHSKGLFLFHFKNKTPALRLNG